MFYMIIFLFVILGVFVALPVYILAKTKSDADHPSAKPISALVAGFTGLLFAALASYWPQWSMLWGHIAASDFFICIVLAFLTAFAAIHLLSMPIKYAFFFMLPVIFAFIYNKSDHVYIFKVLATVSPLLILLFTIIQCILRNRRSIDESKTKSTA